MDPQRLRNRIIVLADEAGLLVLDEDDNRLTSPDTCWVDRRVHCPYGQPEGQYILRPEGFCHGNDGRQGVGCAVYTQHVQDPEPDEELQDDQIRQFFNQHQVTVVSELMARAEELTDATEVSVLQLAADLIKDNKMDRDILLRDDLPVKDA